MALRKTKPKQFFAANNVDTRFNVYGLSPIERQSLKRTIRLCVEDMERKKLLRQATGTHQLEISKLNIKLQIGDLDGTTVDAIGPSEADKIKEMLQMNA
jgi:hypothetical protein